MWNCFQEYDDIQKVSSRIHSIRSFLANSKLEPKSQETMYVLDRLAAITQVVASIFLQLNCDCFSVSLSVSLSLCLSASLSFLLTSPLSVLLSLSISISVCVSLSLSLPAPPFLSHPPCNSSSICCCILFCPLMYYIYEVSMQTVMLANNHICLRRLKK